MLKFIKKSTTGAFAVITGIFMFVPEKFFQSNSWITKETLQRCAWIAHWDVAVVNTVLSRLLCFFVVWGITALLYFIWLLIRRWVTIKGDNYIVRVEYGDILKTKKCKRVINFDECFTTKVGTGIADINPTSICGQYLLVQPELDIQNLIDAANVRPARGKSKYQGKIRYDSGTIVPNGNDLLMAFARLDERGKGRFFSRDEYLECLDLLWKEIENYYGDQDVCVPILGAGITSFDGGSGASISQQDLLDLMIWSYELSSHKIKAPHKLRIICKRNAGFSIDKIKG